MTLKARKFLICRPKDAGFMLRAPAFEWTAERADDWHQAWPGYRPTRYETKAVAAGRPPCYFVFRRR